MLVSLHIENIAVIKSVDLDLQKGFTVLTGETGAGKSIIIDAIGLLLGAKMQKDLIRSGEDTAMVSGLFCDLSAQTRKALEELGVFPDEDGMLLLQRTAGIDGKSRTRLNGRSIPLSLQRQVAELLVDIHGQHDNQKLLDPSSHLMVLDDFAKSEPLLEQYRAIYEKMCAVKREMTELAGSEREKARMTELLKYQIADIDAVSPTLGEEEELEARKRLIRDREKIRKSAGLVSRALYKNDKGMSASEMIAKAASALKTLSPYLPGAEEYAERLNEYRYEIADIGAEALALLEDGEEGEDDLDKIEARLHELSKLKRKYGANIEEVLAYREASAKELQSIEGADERLEELKLMWKELRTSAQNAAEKLSAHRTSCAAVLEERVLEELKFLEMPKVRFRIDIRSLSVKGEPAFRSTGSDSVEFLISPNQGEPLKPLDRIASGGELSRIMLALKSAGAESETDRTGTMIFDEIDTGISGKTSQKIGIRLRKLGEGAQVLCITHSAQIAAVAHGHLLIRKEETGERVETQVLPLSREERVLEIARIMGGAQMTQTLVRSASEMLGEYNPEE